MIYNSTPQKPQFVCRGISQLFIVLGIYYFARGLVAATKKTATHNNDALLMTFTMQSEVLFPHYLITDCQAQI